ncbi:MAG: alpha/beta hydrolase [Gammaproteobacteria bacterium]|nr:alpha/beta hydrolase [Gammaproteobacteria bacterium]
MPVAGRVALYAAVIAGTMYALQDRLLYHPGSETLPELLQYAAALDLRPWPDADNYRAWISAPSTEPVPGTILVFHGNGGLALHRKHYADALVPLGYRVLLVEYPVYGARPGKLGEAAYVADAIETLAEAQRRFGGPIFVYGESLGAAVAAAAVARSTVPVAGVAMITPWTTLPDIAQDAFWFLPARYMVRDRYDNIANLNRWGGRVAVVIAARDEVIPARHGERLFAALTTMKQRWVFPHSGHNDWPAEPSAPWWGEVIQYLNGTSAESGR